MICSCLVAFASGAEFHHSVLWDPPCFLDLFPVSLFSVSFRLVANLARPSTLSFRPAFAIQVKCNVPEDGWWKPCRSRQTLTKRIFFPLELDLPILFLSGHQFRELIAFSLFYFLWLLSFSSLAVFFFLHSLPHNIKLLLSPWWMSFGLCSLDRLPAPDFFFQKTLLKLLFQLIYKLSGATIEVTTTVFILIR